jgi:hypothetical protein
MKDITGKEQKAYLVKDTKTGAVAITYESYAKKLSKEGKKKIIAMEGEKAFQKGKINIKSK